ncbi:unnamed protein product [Cylindrotheca closterium]|uniref:Uncharacterized protein n=1 Tax=Cylindrotheca closterium TaxID=2856 RepID=A0AAD2FGM8_9STRA|nr:unnamed protein product [Cylindrotheca closterium]
MTDWTSTSPSSVLLRYSPKHARKMWIYINSFVLTCSLLLLLEIFLTLEPEDRLEGTRAYLTYNIFVCFAWTVESALHFLQYKHDHHEDDEDVKHYTQAAHNQEQTNTTTPVCDATNPEPKKDHEFYALVVELIFAIYFFYDAVTTLKGLWQQSLGVGAQLFDVTIDVVAYVYLLTRLIMFTEDATTIHGINETRDNVVDDDEDAATPYTLEVT